MHRGPAFVHPSLVLVGNEAERGVPEGDQGSTIDFTQPILHVGDEGERGEQGTSELKQRGIGTSVHWMPLHMHPYYRETYGYQPGDLPIASALYPEIISLPIYPDIAEETVAYVCQSIVEVITRHRK